jgi:hypothetical protein
MPLTLGEAESIGNRQATWFAEPVDQAIEKRAKETKNTQVAPELCYLRFLLFNLSLQGARKQNMFAILAFGTGTLFGLLVGAAVGIIYGLAVRWLGKKS